MNPEIKDFSLQLESNKIVNNKLKAQVLLDLVDPLMNIQSIHVRFVGGIKTNHKSLVGYDKLFDSKIQLAQVSMLEPKEHIFDFELRVPEDIPCFMSYDAIKVEYLLICVIGFQNGCCGLIPILQRNPVTFKKEMHIVNLDLLDTFESRLGPDMKLIQLDAVDYLIWNPAPFLLVKINPLQTIDDWFLRLQLDLNHVLDKVEFAVFEQSLLKYEYL
jgi:hypothetical protein